jgi:bacillaene synthase trans-acting acyltransferase
MFSGQGSQYYHMGKELYTTNKTFKHWMSKINSIIQQNTGICIIEEMYNTAINRSTIFDKLLYTHPAIFMVEYSLARVLIESGVEPDYLLGASLGEFTAAAVAGVISLEETLECLLMQTTLIENSCQKGRMIAIVHSPELYSQSPIISGQSEVAAVNYSTHFVVSGENDNLVPVEEYLRTKEILFLTLPVRYGFHSANMEPIEGEFKKKLGEISYKKPEIPVISCLLTGSIRNICPEHFWNVIRKPIYFQKTIQKLEEDERFHYIDLGPSGTLANFVKRNLITDSLSEIYDVLTPFGQEVKKLQRLKECFN